MTDAERQKILSSETLEVLNPMNVEFTGYNTNVKGYVIIICDDQYPELKKLGYKEISRAERKLYELEMKNYFRKVLYKISEKTLIQRHSQQLTANI